MLNVVILHVVMLNVIMLNVMWLKKSFITLADANKGSILKFAALFSFMRFWRFKNNLVFFVVKFFKCWSHIFFNFSCFLFSLWAYIRSLCNSRNYLLSIISWCVCHCVSISLYSTIYRRGQEPTLTVNSKVKGSTWLDSHQASKY